MREALLGLLERADGLDALGRMEAAEALEQSDDPALLLTTLRSLLRDLAALRAGAGPEALVNADLAARLAPLAAGPLGGAGAPPRRAGRARRAGRCAASRTSSSPSTCSWTPWRGTTRPEPRRGLGRSILAPARRRVLLVHKRLPLSELHDAIEHAGPRAPGARRGQRTWRPGT